MSLSDEQKFRYLVGETEPLVQDVRLDLLYREFQDLKYNDLLSLCSRVSDLDDPVVPVFCENVWRNKLRNELTRNSPDQLMRRSIHYDHVIYISLLLSMYEFDLLPLLQYSRDQNTDGLFRVVASTLSDERIKGLIADLRLRHNGVSILPGIVRYAKLDSSALHDLLKWANSRGVPSWKLIEAIVDTGTQIDPELLGQVLVNVASVEYTSTVDKILASKSPISPVYIGTALMRSLGKNVFRVSDSYLLYLNSNRDISPKLLGKALLQAIDIRNIKAAEDILKSKRPIDPEYLQQAVNTVQGRDGFSNVTDMIVKRL